MEAPGSSGSSATSSPDPSAPKRQRGLTWRSVVVCLVALLLMGIWIEYEEVLNTSGSPLAANAPPNSAIGVMLGLLAVSALLYKLRRRLRLVTAELVVIYSALLVAAPLMTQGMWQRMVALLMAVPHYADFKSYESLPPMIWPHGPNLVANGRFQKELEGFRHVGSGQLRWEDVDRQSKGIWRSPVLSNGGDAHAWSGLSITLPRRDARGKPVLVPGETFLFSCLVKAEDFAEGSAYFVEMQADDGPRLSLLASAQPTAPTFALPEGFARVGACPVMIPLGLKEKLTLTVGLRGDGRLTLQDVQFLNVEAVEGAGPGVKMVRQSNLAKLGEQERDFTVVRPDHLFGLAGLRYLLKGYIPWNQWVQPLCAWSLLVGGLFLGFMGLNVLMRRQWVENERFSFPLNLVPKNLLAEGEDDRRGLFLRIFRNKVMWWGFAVMLPLVLLKGIKFYYPQIPAPVTQGFTFARLVTSPVLKAYLEAVGIGLNTGINFAFCIVAIALLIDTDILFSLGVMFLIFRLWFLCGRAFNFNRFPGYPWDHQQGIGAYIAYALLAVFVGRHHLWKVLKFVMCRRRGDTGLDESQEMVSYRTAILMVLGSLALIVGWGIWTKMGAGASLFFFGYILLNGFVASKIRAECGAPFAYLVPYYGMQFVGAMGGFVVFHSTGMLVATLASGFLCPTVFLLTAPAQVEMMELGRHFSVRPRDIGHGLWLGLLGGVVIGGFVFLCWMYGLGAGSIKNWWPFDQNWYFNSFRSGEFSADRALASGTLHTTPDTEPLNFLHNPDARGLGIGFVITMLLAALRARFAWFPFHPIGYVLASTYFMSSVFYAVVIAWVVRTITFRLGGAHSIRRGLVPFCVGMFLACVVSIVIFDAVGIALRLRGITDVYSGIP